MFVCHLSTKGKKNGMLARWEFFISRKFLHTNRGEKIQEYKEKSESKRSFDVRHPTIFKDAWP